MLRGIIKHFKKDDNLVYQLIREVRPRQWVKSGFVFAALVFGKKFFEIEPFIDTSIAFFVFSFAASFTYIINDISDLEKDKLHPVKCNRPIASGKLSVSTALKAAVVFLSLSLFLAVLVNDYLFYIVLIYIALQFAYTFYLKNYIIIDALAVSVGFILRVFAGGIAASVSISSWLILSVIGVSLLLAFGKRRGERTILSSKNMNLDTRKTLKDYPDTLLNSMISTAAAYSIITYSLFTFQTSPDTKTPSLFASFLPYTLASPKWMMLTIPVVIYGVARYLYVIYESKNAESPERALFEDKPLLYTLGIWGLMILFFYYILGTVNL
ncbi:decaprenyl-phosphate phosphoribosyltransferase [candidate division WWE3 bacterium CG10_big_fil_rev_8_21_14_0_10_32_10]|uniref:Decaprenyl-phosphate phosphoribosyltransferase n=1 Tax=candidate division WWE3 bacterium CG10_big_fil_rev_8_21_14_0_10_32_10 TaxID=1975090 RepID=A0A2H0RB58_UNCKA|nr:MAG: decaprenyl-phosphate phosphoribosyltransferase [candidate division WWE3 bacterium CG10_big_fil_rev_8_21_14_0_10_32_10]